MKAIIVVFILSLLLMATGCSSESDKTKVVTPSAKLDLSITSIKITDQSISKDFITATITRSDSKNEEQTFTIRFPKNISDVYATDVDGNRIQTLETKTLKGKNSIDTLQFKIFGTKREAVKVLFELEVELLWGDFELDTKIIKIEVE